MKLRLCYFSTKMPPRDIANQCTRPTAWPGIADLSPDLIVLICSHLPLRDRIGLTEVCRRFRDIFTSDEFWGSLISPKLADHDEALHTQAYQIGTAHWSSPFCRHLDGAVVSLDPVSSSTCLHQRISMEPGNLEVSCLPQGSDSIPYWGRGCSESAPGLTVLTFQGVRDLRVATELLYLPRGTHIVAFHVRYLGNAESSGHPIWGRPILPPLLKFTCVVTNESGVERDRIVLDAGAPSAFAKAHIRTVKLFPGQSTDGWNRLEVNVSVGEGDDVTMYITSTADDERTSLELGSCEALISDYDTTTREWRMYNTEKTTKGTRSWNLVARGGVN